MLGIPFSLHKEVNVCWLTVLLHLYEFILMITVVVTIYTYKFSRYVIFVVEQFSGISWFYFRGLPSIQKYLWVLFSRVFSNVWSRISALQKISFTVYTDLANNSSPSHAVCIQCLIAQSNEIIEGRGIVPFAYFILFCLGWRFMRKMGAAPSHARVVFN